MEATKNHLEHQWELLDLRDFPIPFYNESGSVAMMEPEQYTDPAATKWATKIGEMDGFLVVAQEYNHGYTAVLKNALDYAFKQWHSKPMSFVSYGGAAGGARAVEQLRGVAIELQLIPLRNQVVIPLYWSAFNQERQPNDEGHNTSLQGVLTELSSWTTKLKTIRNTKSTLSSYVTGRVLCQEHT